MKVSQEKNCKDAMNRPTFLEETANLKVCSPSLETKKWGAEPPRDAWSRDSAVSVDSLNLQRLNAATRIKREVIKGVMSDRGSETMTDALLGGQTRVEGKARQRHRLEELNRKTRRKKDFDAYLN